VILDSLKQAIKDKAKEGSFKVKRPYAKRYKRVAGDWIRLSDVLKLVSDLEKTHIIKSKQELKDKYREVCKTRIQNIADDAIAFFIEELTGLEPEELLGEEKK